MRIVISTLWSIMKFHFSGGLRMDLSRMSDVVVEEAETEVELWKPKDPIPLSKGF